MLDFHFVRISKLKCLGEKASCPSWKSTRYLQVWRMRWKPKAHTHALGFTHTAWPGLGFKPLISIHGLLVSAVFTVSTIDRYSEFSILLSASWVICGNCTGFFFMYKVSVHFMENKLAIIKNSFREMLYTELRRKQLGFMVCSLKTLRVHLELFGM